MDCRLNSGGKMKKVIDGIEVNDKSIITSLKIIKQVCEDNLINDTDCNSECPFFADETKSCGIQDTSPDNWKILGYTKFQALG